MENKKEDKPNLRRTVLWARFDRMINMTPSQIRSVRDSEEGKDSGLSKEEAREAGANLLTGQEASKRLENLLKKVGDYRGQYKKIPNLTDEEWGLLGTVVRFNSRFFYNIGELKDEEGNDTPKSLSLKLRGLDGTKVKNLPNKDIVKMEVKTSLKTKD
jgi:hypothetical protein